MTLKDLKTEKIDHGMCAIYKQKQTSILTPYICPHCIKTWDGEGDSPYYTNFHEPELVTAFRYCHVYGRAKLKAKCFKCSSCKNIFATYSIKKTLNKSYLAIDIASFIVVILSITYLIYTRDNTTDIIKALTIISASLSIVWTGLISNIIRFVVIGDYKKLPKDIDSYIDKYTKFRYVNNNDYFSNCLTENYKIFD